MKKDQYSSPERDFYKVPDAKWLMRKLWMCSGGDRYILSRATYADQVKYACLGGIIVATGAMAMLAGGYAFYTIFSPKDEHGWMMDSPFYSFLSCIFGIIWGLIIFNIDRFIVTSTGKGDGTEKITWDEFKGAIPRIIMGIVIAITISLPMEIRIFQTEIQAGLIEAKQKQEGTFVGGVEKRYKERLKQIDAEIPAKKIEIQNKKNSYLTSIGNAKAICSSGGENCPHSGTHRKLWQVAGSDEADWNLTKTTLLPQIADLEKEKKDILSKEKTEKESARKDGEQLDGLSKRIEIMHEKVPFLISAFITLLFLVIELTPIFFKLMLTKTPYDYLAENRDDLIKAENGIEVKYDFYKDKEGLERHLVIHHAKERMLSEKILLSNAEKLLSEYAVNKYIEREKKKIDEDNDNLGGYITTSPQNDA